MVKLDFNGEFFNPKDVLTCGQTFRFRQYKQGYLVFTRDKACYVYTDNGRTFVECEDGGYFYNYFDLGREYARIIDKARAFGVPLLTRGCEAGKGLRLLNQDGEEMIFSYIISQNNNIPRISSIIERLCVGAGEKRQFLGETYYTFPTAAALAEKPREFFSALGAGYRDEYLYSAADKLAKEGTDGLYSLTDSRLKNKLLTFKGIGAKVADCICLFGFGRRSCFPVDTWIEKIYREDFGGTLKDRNKISDYFCSLFGEEAGYIQQYLFYAKRESM